MELSNKALALLLVVALVVSMSGTLLSLSKLEQVSPQGPAQVSGNAQSDVGNVTLQINTTASLIFVSGFQSINFGSGYVNVTGGYNNCTLSSQGVVTQYNCVGFNNVTSPLVLMNNGNRNLSVDLQSNINATALLGGNNPLFQWNITNNQTGACQVNLFPYNGTFQDVNFTLAQTICGDMNWVAGSNTFNIHVLVRIPSTSFAGQRNATFTATGSVI